MLLRGQMHWQHPSRLDTGCSKTPLDVECKQWHWNIENHFFCFYVFSQTWVNNLLPNGDHLSTTTNILRSQLRFYRKNDLWTTTTCQQWPLFLGTEGGRCKRFYFILEQDFLEFNEFGNILDFRLDNLSIIITIPKAWILKRLPTEWENIKCYSFVIQFICVSINTEIYF